MYYVKFMSIFNVRLQQAVFIECQTWCWKKRGWVSVYIWEGEKNVSEVAHRICRSLRRAGKVFVVVYLVHCSVRTTAEGVKSSFLSQSSIFRITKVWEKREICVNILRRFGATISNSPEAKKLRKLLLHVWENKSGKSGRLKNGAFLFLETTRASHGCYPCSG